MVSTECQIFADTGRQRLGGVTTVVVQVGHFGAIVNLQWATIQDKLDKQQQQE